MVQVIELRFAAHISTNVAQYSTINKNSKFEKCGAAANFVFFNFLKNGLNY